MIPLACPRCHILLQELDPATKHCTVDGLSFFQLDGIWRMLLPGRAEIYARFTRDYEAVRRAEGRGSKDASYYRTLPYHPGSDWKIRAASFDAFIRHVLAPAPEENKSSLQILDLGAGNGWLSNRLAGLGHSVAALDLTVNDFDGLGCRSLYETTFLAVQAEFEHLPIKDRSIDMIVFNASLHYSTGYESTLKEALRALKETGSIVVLDSPVYYDAESGAKMVSEREAEFIHKYGFASNQLSSENYLTYGRLDDLARGLGLTWEIITPFYGLRWSLRPFLAKLSGRREPAKFHVLIGRPNRLPSASLESARKGN